MTSSCSNGTIFIGSAWYWFMAPKNPNTGVLLTTGTKPTCSYSFNGGNSVDINTASVEWGSWDENGYEVPSNPTYTLRVTVPAVTASGLVIAKAVFANPDHVEKVRQEISL